MSLPIIIIHKGDSLFLWYIIKQAQYFNPRSDIFLIGDEYNRRHEDIAKHYFVDQYMESASDFSSYYKHFSPNSREYELFCFQRWFVLLEFMKKQSIERCVHIDSDVLLYTDVSAESYAFRGFDFTVNNGRVGHCMFVNSVSGLEKLCEYMLNLYKTKSIDDLKSVFEEYLRIDGIGGISDMSVLFSYQKMHPALVGETMSIRDNSVFDHNINVSDGFEMKNSRKRIFFKNKIPFGVSTGLKKVIRFSCLHFQGYAKIYIPFYFSNKDARYYIQLIRTVCTGVYRKYIVR